MRLWDSQQLCAGIRHDISRSAAVLAQEAMRRLRETIAALTRIDDQDLATCPRKLKSRGEAGIAAANDNCVEHHACLWC
jgi:hypothetical protein